MVQCGQIGELGKQWWEMQAMHPQIFAGTLEVACVTAWSLAESRTSLRALVGICELRKTASEPAERARPTLAACKLAGPPPSCSPAIWRPGSLHYRSDGLVQAAQSSFGPTASQCQRRRGRGGKARRLAGAAAEPLPTAGGSRGWRILNRGGLIGRQLACRLGRSPCRQTCLPRSQPPPLTRCTLPAWHAFRP